MKAGDYANESNPLPEKASGLIIAESDAEHEQTTTDGEMTSSESLICKNGNNDEEKVTAASISLDLLVQQSGKVTGENNGFLETQQTSESQEIRELEEARRQVSLAKMRLARFKHRL
jgi:anionic cell wall polymer biosynthesis LytR-Cps2A-Psr (LCP) family protein